MKRLRTDRVVSLWLVHPVRRMLSREKYPHVPILMYHSVSEGSSDRRPYHDINASPFRFSEQMKFLRELGYQAVRPGEAARILSTDKPDGKHVVITFDDGYRDFATAAYPILKQFGHSATLYVPSGLIGDRRSWFNGRECLTWSEIRELHSNGIEIGSHSVSHRELKTLDRASLHSELEDSRKMIGDKIGAPPASFAYPYAFPETNINFVKGLRQSLVEIGYETCVTTILGRAHRSSDPLLLPRLPVNSHDDLDLFRAKLEGSYDWLHTAQYALKRGKDLRNRVRTGDRWPQGETGPVGSESVPQ